MADPTKKRISELNPITSRLFNTAPVPIDNPAELDSEGNPVTYGSEWARLNDFEVVEYVTTTPPLLPIENAKYLINGVGTDVFATHDNTIAMYHNTEWNFFSPITNKIYFDSTNGSSYMWNGSSFESASLGSGGGSNKNVVQVNPDSLVEVEGKVYNTYASALAYIITQTPAIDNSWTIELPGGDFSENVEFNEFINIRGHNTRLTGTLTSNYFFVGDSDIILTNTTFIEGCIVLNMYSLGVMNPPSNISIFPMNNCFIDLDSGTVLPKPTLTLALMITVDSQIMSGDFSTVMVSANRSIILGGLFGTLLGDMQLLNANNSLITLNVSSVIGGGDFFNCKISSESEFSSGTYIIKNCSLSDIIFSLDDMLLPPSVSYLEASNSDFSSCSISASGESEVKLIQTHVDEYSTINLLDSTVILTTIGCSGFLDEIGETIISGNISSWNNILDIGATTDQSKIFPGVVKIPTWEIDVNILKIYADGIFNVQELDGEIKTVVASPLLSDPYELDCSTLPVGVITYLFIDVGGRYNLAAYNKLVQRFDWESRTPIFTICYDGITTQVNLSRETAIGLPIRLDNYLKKTDSYKILNKYIDCLISEYSVDPADGRYVLVGNGVLGFGVDEIYKDNINTYLFESLLKYHYLDTGAWTTLTTTKYNNTQFNGALDLELVSADHYVVNWLYIDIFDSNIVNVLLGEGDYTYNQALASREPLNLPDYIKLSNNTLLIGRIIVKSGEETAVLIQNFIDGVIPAYSIIEHDDMDGISGNGFEHLSTTQVGYVDNIPTISAVSELIPVEVFDDGIIPITPPSDILLIDGVVRYRDFSIGDGIKVAYPKPREYVSTNTPMKVGVKLIVTDVNGLSTGDILNFTFKFKKPGGTVYSTTLIGWESIANYARYDVITIDPIDIVFTPETDIFDLNVLELERTNSGDIKEYIYDIGVIYLELLWSKI